MVLDQQFITLARLGDPFVLSHSLRELFWSVHLQSISMIFLQCNFHYYHYYYVTLLRVFHTNVSWWFHTGV